MTNQSKLDKEYEEVTNEYKIWKPVVNDEIIGKIVKQQKGKFGLSYVLEKDNEMFLLPNHRVLTDLLNKCHIGDSVKIVCSGKVAATKEGNNDTMMYKVFVKKA